jgi:cytochrome oxidase Cu insertion factor (SCO1/SenC/PrrC family)
LPRLRVLYGAAIAVAVLAIAIALLIPLLAPARGSLLVLASAEAEAPAAIGPIDLTQGGSWLRVGGGRSTTIPTSPQTTTLAGAEVAAGRYTQLRIGDTLLLGSIDVAPGRVETVLVPFAGGRPLAGSLYAGTEAVNLGLAELGHRYTPVGSFSLTDQYGRSFDETTIRGRELVVAAFHTTCRTTCPLYTGLFAQLQRKAPPSTLLVEVTTDPVHDSPRVLADYSSTAGVTWKLATGDPAQVSAFWAPFGVSLSDEDAHASTLAIVDRWGYVRITYQGVPDVGGRLPDPLAAQLNAEGRAEVAHGGIWGAPQVLDSLRTLQGIAQRSDTGGGAAPSFRLTTTEGRQVALEDLRGRPLVINFWSAGCPPCRSEMPMLERFAGAHPGVTVLLVDVYNDTPTARRFLRDLGVRMPALVDQTGEVASAYGVSGLPTTFFVRPDATIEGRYVGQLSEPVLTAHVASLEQPPR